MTSLKSMNLNNYIVIIGVTIVFALSFFTGASIVLLEAVWLVRKGVVHILLKFSTIKNALQRFGLLRRV